MSQYTALYQYTIQTVTSMLQINTEWISRYKGYTDSIKNNESIIKLASNCFGAAPNLDIYLPISKAKQSNSRTVYLDVRYKGQSIAELRIGIHTNTVRLSVKTSTNMRDYCEYPPELEIISEKNLIDWHSDKASAFRKFFASNPKRNSDTSIAHNISISKKKKKENLEHNYESQLLKQFTLKTTKGKILRRIQPVTLFQKKFQMPTPIYASKAANSILKYSNQWGGGVDILARYGHGRGTYLTVIELKDKCEKKEPPEKAIAQAIAYATFLWRLLRTPQADSNGWWELFGFRGIVPHELKIKVVIAMPEGNYNDTLFANERLYFLNTKDFLELNYIYFNAVQNKITGITKTSLLN